MAKYIRTYSNNSEYETDKTKKYPHVGYIEDTKEVKYLTTKPYREQYLTFDAIDNILLNNNNYQYRPLYYSLDDGKTWGQIPNVNAARINAGTSVIVKGDAEYHFSISGRFNVKGNILSLLYGDDFNSATGTNIIKRTFAGSSGLVSAENLILPENIGESAFLGMFNGCTSLTTAPALPATTLSQKCYENMFAGCTSLTTAPALSATALANGCYKGMFSRCTSLTTAPELHASTLADSCYYMMFSGCTSLTEAPALPATTLAGSCYNNMFRNCTLLTTAPALPATTLAEDCYAYMFNGCTSLTTAPELPANRLYPRCYYTMFSECRALSYVKMLASEGIDEYNALYAFLSSTNGGTVAKNPLLAEADLRKYIPRIWTIVDATD